MESPEPQFFSRKRSFQKNQKLFFCFSEVVSETQGKHVFPKKKSNFSLVLDDLISWHEELPDYPTPTTSLSRTRILSSSSLSLPSFPLVGANHSLQRKFTPSCKVSKCHLKVDAVSAFSLVQGYNTFSFVLRTIVVYSYLEVVMSCSRTYSKAHQSRSIRCEEPQKYTIKKSRMLAAALSKPSKQKDFLFPITTCTFCLLGVS